MEPTICHLIMGIMPLIIQPLPLTTPLLHITPKPHPQNVSLKLLVQEAVGMASSSCCLILMDMDVMVQVSKFTPVMKNPAPLIATGAHGDLGPNVRSRVEGNVTPNLNRTPPLRSLLSSVTPTIPLCLKP